MPQPEKEDSLLRLLREKSGTYPISKDGYISRDRDHPEVRKSFRRQIEQFRELGRNSGLVSK